jgi:hypothetical protein
MSEMFALVVSTILPVVMRQVLSNRGHVTRRDCLVIRATPVKVTIKHLQQYNYLAIGLVSTSDHSTGSTLGSIQNGTFALRRRARFGRPVRGSGRSRRRNRKADQVGLS